MAILVVTALPGTVAAAGLDGPDESKTRGVPVVSSQSMDISEKNVNASADGGTVQPGGTITIQLRVERVEGSGPVGVGLYDIPGDWSISGTNADGADFTPNGTVEDGTSRYTFAYNSVDAGVERTPSITLSIPSNAEGGTYTLGLLASVGEGDATAPVTVTVGTAPSTNSIGPNTGSRAPSLSESSYQILLRTEDSNHNAKIDYQEVLNIISDYNNGLGTFSYVLEAIEAFNEERILEYPDSDGDGLTNREETLLSSDPYLKNTDGDQFIDPRDSRPATEDEPPQANLTFSNGGSKLTVNATDNDRLALIELHERGTESYTLRPITGTSAGETFTLPNTGTQYWVNVSDANGNRFSILLKVRSGGTVKIKKAGFSVFGLTALSPAPGDEVIGGIILLVTILLAATVEFVFNGDGGSQRIAYTSTAVEYSNAASSVTQHINDENLPIRLPSGAVEEVSDPAGGSLFHGYGWEYIQLVLPGITQNQIGDILRTPSKVEELDDGVLVIGDNPNGDGLVHLILKAGSIVFAANIIDSYPGESVIPYTPVLTDEGWEHILNSHPEMTQELLHQIIENGNQVSKHRVYRKGKLGEDGPVSWTWVAVIDGTVYMVRATITDITGQVEVGTARDTEKTLSEYVQDLKEKGYSRIDN